MSDVAHQAPSIMRLEGGLHVRGEFYKHSEPGKPLVTVVTVVRNGKEHIERTIQSVLDQTYENIQYVIIDGASTDGTIDIIRKYDHAIAYWVSEPDTGIYDAMNKGIDLSAGDWINFMNSGDRFYENSTVQKVIENHPGDADLIYGHHQMIYDPGFSKLQEAKEMKNLWKGMVFCHQSVFVKRALMKMYKFNIRNKIAADFELLYALYINKYVFYNSDIVISAITAEGFSGTNTIATIKDQWQAVHKFTNNLRVNTFYTFKIFDRLVKIVIKAMLPKKLVNFIRIKL
jgi:glycosyltransferase involved in cell wall biosynthesis